MVFLLTHGYRWGGRHSSDLICWRVSWAQGYLTKNADKLKLKDEYPLDPVIKRTIDDFVHASQTVAKGNFRRQVSN